MFSQRHNQRNNGDENVAFDYDESSAKKNKSDYFERPQVKLNLINSNFNAKL